MAPTDSKRISIDTLREALVYDPETGLLHWRVKNNARWRGGGRAGWISKSTGYYVILFKRQKFLLHRVGWALTHNRWPPADLDHINGDPADNRLVNLREATRSENCANSRRPKSNTTGFKGVSQTKSGRWHAIIGHNGRTIYGSRFDTPEEAHADYMRLAESLFGEFARAA